jgi:hypothetical protein
MDLSDQTEMKRWAILFYFILRQTSYYVTQANLKPVGSNGPPASTSGVAGRYRCVPLHPADDQF